MPVSGAPRVVVDDGFVRSDGATVLGADDKAAVAVLLVLARALVAEPPAGDVELVFTAGEEAGLLGAKALDLTGLTARRVFVLDSDGAPGTLIVASPTQKRVTAEFQGVAAHAGIAPERGRNAIVAAARAIGAMRLGRIDDETTANIGMVSGGTASNVVAERCVVAGEARSQDPAKVATLAEEMVQAMAAEAGAAGIDVEIDVQRGVPRLPARAGQPAAGDRRPGRGARGSRGPPGRRRRRLGRERLQRGRLAGAHARRRLRERALAAGAHEPRAPRRAGGHGGGRGARRRDGRVAAPGRRVTGHRSGPSRARATSR